MSDLKNRVAELESHVSALSKQVDQIKEQIGETGDRKDYRVWKTDGAGNKIPTSRARKVIQKLKDKERLSTSKVARIYGCTNDTARENIMRQLDDGHNHIKIRETRKGFYLVWDRNW